MAPNCIKPQLHCAFHHPSIRTLVLLSSPSFKISNLHIFCNHPLICMCIPRRVISRPPVLCIIDMNHCSLLNSASMPILTKRPRENDVACTRLSECPGKRLREEPAENVEPHWGCHTAIGGRPYQEDTHVTAQQLHGSSSHQLFGVFDGHGGSFVSTFLAEHSAAYVSAAMSENLATPGRQLETVALREAFVRLDADLPCIDTKDLGGSTAVVVLLSKNKLTCANTGDSRAVLARNGEAVALSDDHKPEREDEQARVHASGGRILHNSGMRVMGVLGMTRAIGDTWLRKFGVIPDPDVVELDRCPEDEFIIIASDGLWGAVSSVEAVHVARRCLNRATSKGVSREAAARIAAKVLMRAAMSRGSRDNITVIVIDLQEERIGQSEGVQQPSACGCALAVHGASAPCPAQARSHYQCSGLPSPSNPVVPPTLDMGQDQEEDVPQAYMSLPLSIAFQASVPCIRTSAGTQRLHLNGPGSPQLQQMHSQTQQWNQVSSSHCSPSARTWGLSGTTSTPISVASTRVQALALPFCGSPRAASNMEQSEDLEARVDRTCSGQSSAERMAKPGLSGAAMA